MLFLGIDIGSSSIKVALLDGQLGRTIASAQYPESEELPINAPKQGFAEQDPESWWQGTVHAFNHLKKTKNFDPATIGGIGISYQMHGLVMLDEAGKVLRPSIIWCDSRAVELGDKAFETIGTQRCLNQFLNSPGNFTASKLAWVKQNEPQLYRKLHKIMLPGDFIAYKLSGDMTTTVSGLSEGVLWDFKKNSIADEVLDHYGIEEHQLSDIVPTLGIQTKVGSVAADELGIRHGTPITYRAGDQPNNAFSLNVLKPGEVAATAGTSAVIYAVTDQDAYDRQSRVNTFLHVNNATKEKRNGVLVCVNGSGILYNWLRKIMGTGHQLPDYETLNALSKDVSPGSEGLQLFPFGNGAERILTNKNVQASMRNLDFNIHQAGHVVRAAKEGIVFALKYGFDILSDMGVGSNVVRAGKANMFLSPVFRETFVNTTKTELEFYDTNGAEGAARAAALGAGFYKNEKEAFTGLQCIDKISPDLELVKKYEDIYGEWKSELISTILI
ncbi:MAG TPA: carbohydrate kinase [Cytophagales bacterium]|jgi:xylulokinase|nr:carbohydrate kinase [Cytophagales bacterium]